MIYLTYSFINRVFHKPVEITRTGTKDPIRIEVLNGCGINRLASRVTDFLRDQGFDVVKTDDAPTTDYTLTIVQDRAGDIENANKVAYALGITPQNITQQINEDLFLDVTVIIGLDYKSYKPFKK